MKIEIFGFSLNARYLCPPKKQKVQNAYNTTIST